MRRLLLLRHAKAEPATGHDDYDRELTEGGAADAKRIGERIAAEGLIPDLVIYSGAERTRQTAAAIAEGWPRAVAMRAQNGLYDATRPLIFEAVRALPDEARTAMLVGHNPGIGDLANWLTGKGGEALRLRMAGKYPTCALATLEFPVKAWAQIAPHSARLMDYVTPADLPAPGGKSASAL